MLLFQSRLNYTNAQADNQYAVWSGLCYCAPLFGGLVADAYWGRFKTIAVFSCVYLVGLLVLVVGVLPRDVTATGGWQDATEALVFLGIYLLALGDGGIKPNVSTFGGDQYDVRLAQGKKAMDSFFSYFYAAINCGALISFTLIVTITQYGVPWLGGADYRFAVGFCIAALFTAAGICIFLSGRSRYRMLPPSGSVLATSLGILCQAARRGVQAWWHGGAPGRRSSPRDTLAVPWLDRAKAVHGGSFAEADVEGVKCVCRLLPFLFFLVPYWSIYTQMSTSFQNQGCQMDLSLRPWFPATKIAVSTLNLFDTLGIICLVPVFDRLIFPFFQRKDYPLTQLQRMGAGFLLAALAMLAAGFLELYRKAQAPVEFPYPTDPADTAGIAYLTSHVSACKMVDDFNPFKFQAWFATGGATRSSSPAPAACFQSGPALPDGTLPLTSITCEDVPLFSPVSVFWQTPQFLLIGISEILTSITSYAFFFQHAPKNMRSFCASLNLLTTALGTWLCIPLVALANSGPVEWVPANLNEGALAHYFFLLAAIMAAMTAGFVVVARRFQETNERPGPVVEEDGEGWEEDAE